MTTNGKGHPSDGDGSSLSPRPDPVVRKASTPLTALYERTGSDGNRYLIGRIGGARLIIVRTRERSHGCAVWQAVLAPGPDPHPDAQDLAKRVDEGGVTFLGPVTAGAR